MSRFSIHAAPHADTFVNSDTEPASVADLPDSADELAAKMREERMQLKNSLQALGSAVKEKVEWRSHVREHPVAVAGVGFLVGVAIGVLSERPGIVRSAPGASGRTRPKKGVGLNMLANMSATVAAIVGGRVAGVAEDALRDALSRHRGR